MAFDDADNEGHKEDSKANYNSNSAHTDLGILVDIPSSESPAMSSPMPARNGDSQRSREKIHSPTSSFASFHSIEDDGLASIPVLQPSSSRSQSDVAATQDPNTTITARSSAVKVEDDRQLLETRLEDLGYAASDVQAVAGLLCSLPKSNLRKCLADTAFLKRKAEEAMRILQADDEEEEEL